MSESLHRDRLLDMYRQMVLIRQFEGSVVQSKVSAKMIGAVSSHKGYEAVAVGVGAALRQQDLISTSTVFGPAVANGITIEAIVTKLSSQANGNAIEEPGCIGLADAAQGVVSSRVRGGNVSIAAGLAFGIRHFGTDQIAVCFLTRDMGNQDDLHGGMKLAALYELPVVFVAVDGNDEGTRMPRSNSVMLASELGVATKTVDCSDVFEIGQATSQAVERTRMGQGPTFIQCVEVSTKQLADSQHGISPNISPTQKQPATGQARDPVDICGQRLVDECSVSEQQLRDIDTECRSQVEAAVEHLLVGPRATREELFHPVFAEIEASEAVGITDDDSNRERMTLREAVCDAIRVLLTSDEFVSVWSSDSEGDVGDSIRQSCEFHVEEIKVAEIANTAILAAAIGAAMTGCRSIASIARCENLSFSIAEVLSFAGRVRYTTNERFSVPVVLRLPTGGTTQRMQMGPSIETLVSQTPGLKIVCPSNPYDAKGLLLAAARDQDPVVFLEHDQLFGESQDVQHAVLDSLSEVPAGSYTVQLNKAVIRREGGDLTILANMLMVHRVLRAADVLAADEIDVEVIDLRCLVPLDIETLVASGRKTRRILIVEEDCLAAGWGAHVSHQLSEALFGELLAPVRRIAAPDLPGVGANVRQEYISVERILSEARALAYQMPADLIERVGASAEIHAEASYTCDACGEEIVVPLDLTEGSHQQYVEDCPVCCRANVIHVEVDEVGEVRVWSLPEQDY